MSRGDVLFWVMVPSISKAILTHFEYQSIKSRQVLLASLELGCTEEALTIIAMLSVQNVFYRPKDKQVKADNAKSKFNQAEGDHLTLLAVYEAWARYASLVLARACGVWYVVWWRVWCVGVCGWMTRLRRPP